MYYAGSSSGLASRAFAPRLNSVGTKWLKDVSSVPRLTGRRGIAGSKYLQRERERERERERDHTHAGGGVFYRVTVR